MTNFTDWARMIDDAIIEADGRCGIYVTALDEHAYWIRPSNLVPAGQTHTSWGFKLALPSTQPAA